MTRIVIRNIAQLKALNKKLRVIAATLPTLQTRALEKVAADTVLTNIHREMKANNFSEKIIDATFVGPIELLNNGQTAKIHFISDYVSDTGFDVSNAREEGTASGVLRRAKKPGGSLRWIGKSGEPIFRKSSRPKGMERLLIIETNIRKSKTAFRENYDTQIVSTLNELVRI